MDFARSEGGAKRAPPRSKAFPVSLALLFPFLPIAVDRIEHFAPMHWHFLRGLDPQADLVTSNLHNHYRNVIVDNNTLVLLTTQNQHCKPLYLLSATRQSTVQSRRR